MLIHLQMLRMKGYEAMDTVTFQTEVKQREKLLFRIAWSYMKNYHDAEDMVQEAVAIAWQKKEMLRDEKLFGPWLTRILCNQCVQILRRRKKFSFYPLEMKELTDDRFIEEIPDTDIPVLEAIDSLNPEIRLLLTLHYVDGFTMREISEKLGIPMGTIRNRLLRGRKQLKEKLSVEWEETI